MRDAVIVGAGHNGLVAVAYLARAGLDVEVLERRDVVGGGLRDRGAVARRPRLAGGLHAVALRRRIIDELRLRDHGLRVDVHEPYLFAPQPGRTGGRDLVLAQAHAGAVGPRLVGGRADAYAARADRWAAPPRAPARSCSSRQTASALAGSGRGDPGRR